MIIQNTSLWEQGELQADAADAHILLWEGCGADGQLHHDMQILLRASGKNTALEKLLPHIWENLGFVFTKDDLTEIRNMMLAKKVPAATCADAIAVCEVTVPAQNTDLGPEKTSFFQALGITMKISRGTIEILSDVQLLKIREKVKFNEAILLNMLNISPFFFGLVGHPAVV